MKVFNPKSIKKIREEKKLSQHQFSQKLGGTYQAQHVQNWECGRMKPSIVSLVRISEAFKKPLGYFFIDKDYHSNNKGGKNVQEDVK